ncbi:MAG TPA: plastocyanin/azurin family copper-binding protein [Candidatus Bathyarchaeia archaeon]|nr:plastocyanin/azurin family copper-binding protein [Candidatus Bathyarchaeia archaeon]
MSSPTRSLSFIVTAAGLTYFILFASVQIVTDWISGNVPFYDYIHIPFMILFALSILATWAKPKVGYIMGVISGVVGIAVLSPFTFVKGVSSPADFGLFFYAITIFPIMLAAALYSLMAFMDLRKSSRPISLNRMYLRRLIIILILGFMIGGVTVGSLAAGTENPLLASASSNADITIPRGAAVQGNTAYSPGNFTVSAGKTVIWVNKDTTVHTVTSVSGSFDSLNLNPGQTYGHAFAQSGVYKYYCTLHPWMKGNVTVTP